MTSKLLDAARALHNHICLLYDVELVRVTGIHFDGVDAYYRVQRMGSHGTPGAATCASMVGGCESLKGVLSRYERTDELFAMNGCPPTDAFAVTADTRRQFGEMAGDHALRHYDEDVAPLLIAHGGTPDDGGADPAVEARAMLEARHPGHAEALARLTWLGTHEGSDRYINPDIGGFEFERATGAVESDFEGAARHDLAAIMARLAA